MPSFFALTLLLAAHTMNSGDRIWITLYLKQGASSIG